MSARVPRQTIIEAFVDPARGRHGRAAQRRDRDRSSARRAASTHIKCALGAGGATHLANWLVDIGAERRLSRLPVHGRRGAGPQPARASCSRARRQDRSLRRLPGARRRAHRHDAGRRSRGAAAAPAASCSRACSRTRRAACSRARSSCARTRRRPTASRWRRCSCCRRMPSSIPSPSSRSLPTTWSAATARPAPTSTRICCSTASSRGIPEAEARALLIESFIGEAIEKVEHEDVREALAALAATGSTTPPAARGMMATGPHDTQELQRDAGTADRSAARRRPTTSSASAPISRSSIARSTASRSSISTTPPRRRSRVRCIEAMDHAYRFEYANVHRGLHYPVEPLDLQVRGRARGWCGASSTPAAWTRSSSRATPPRPSISSPTASAPNIGEGDEIVLSIMEHHSNIVPWHFLRERQRRGAEVGADRRRRRIAARRVRAAVDARAPSSSPSRTCRTCSARWCR